MRKELILSGVIYFVTVSILLMAVYQFLENWQMSRLNFFVAGALVLLVALGWGYLLIGIIFTPQKQIKQRLSTVTDEIVHELNIPLSTIQANTQMLYKSATDEKSHVRLARIEAATLRLKKLYDELVYTLKKEIYAIPKEKVALDVLIQERLALFEEQGRNPFVSHLSKVTREIDKIGFEQMFDNLIDNAMKYSDKNRAIHVTLQADSLRIQDHGVGMSPTTLLRIYEHYFQDDTTAKGQGIGLALVKRYCDSENIEINITSDVGKGTTVNLDLSRV